MNYVAYDPITDEYVTPNGRVKVEDIVSASLPAFTEPFSFLQPAEWPPEPESNFRHIFRGGGE